jgi:periplasmic protein TonB
MGKINILKNKDNLKTIMKKNIYTIIFCLVISSKILGQESLQSKEIVKIRPEKEEFFTVVEQPAEFPGGQTALNKFLTENIKYSKLALENNVKGKIYLKFVVNKLGEILDISILKGLGFGLDEEAIRVVKLMPKWKPAKQAGKKVNYLVQLGYNFVLP